MKSKDCNRDKVREYTAFLPVLKCTVCGFLYGSIRQKTNTLWTTEDVFEYTTMNPNSAYRQREKKRFKVTVKSLYILPIIMLTSKSAM